ncbi:MAG: DNA-binding domain-containing protein [Vicinamibacterales bacterium]
MQTADVQRRFMHAMVSGEPPWAWDATLAGGACPARRLAIHVRHYRSSLTRAIVERFPATVWLTGSAFVAGAATAFVQGHPPERPCIAEYGERFPRSLARMPAASALPYLEQFATIDWHLGRLAIATDEPAVTSLDDCGPDCIVDVRLRLQTGLAYLAVDWSLDELFAFYLSGDPPDQYEIRRERTLLELRGSRGDLSIQRLSGDAFTFRSALHAGIPLGEAETAALAIHDKFDLASATIALMSERLIIAVEPH